MNSQLRNMCTIQYKEIDFTARYVVQHFHTQQDTFI